MKIIIEGLDNVGKSTLISNIIKEYKKPFLCLHYYANPDKNDPIKWGKKQYNKMFDVFYANDYVIADRAHLGELVYPKMYNGYDGNYVKELEKKYNTKRILLITLVDEPENLIARDDGLSFSTDIDKKTEEVQLFVDAHEASVIEHKHLINVANYNEDALKYKVFNYINKMENI